MSCGDTTWEEPVSILEPSRTVEKLAQGDLLFGLPLYHTTLFDEDAPAASSAQLCIVILRPCVLEHKETILVAAVLHSKDVSSSASFEDTRDYLVSLREGEGKTDRFYLGQLGQFIQESASYEHRLCRHFAHLDSLHTLRLCKKTSDAETRKASLNKLIKARVASLSRDFVRNLQTRLFGALAYEGFDDYAWYTNKDLELLISAAYREIQQARVDLNADFARLDSAGQSDPDIEKMKLKRENTIRQLENKIRPYKEELERRTEQ
jgi:hypothetical protein